MDDYVNLYSSITMGGIHRYLIEVNKGQSAQQMIDKLFFKENGMLKTEFEVLYRSLFDTATHHEDIVRALSMIRELREG